MACLVAPFWLHFYQMSVGKLMIFTGLFVSFKWLIMAIRGRLNVQFRGWRSVIRLLPIFIGAIFLWQMCYKIYQTKSLFIHYPHPPI